LFEISNTLRRRISSHFIQTSQFTDLLQCVYGKSKDALVIGEFEKEQKGV